MTVTAKEKVTSLIRTFGAANASGDPSLMQFASQALGDYINTIDVIEQDDD